MLPISESSSPFFFYLAFCGGASQFLTIVLEQVLDQSCWLESAAIKIGFPPTHPYIQPSTHLPKIIIWLFQKINQNASKMPSKCSQNALKTLPKGSQTAFKITPVFSRNVSKILPNCSNYASKMASKGSQFAPKNVLHCDSVVTYVWQNKSVKSIDGTILRIVWSDKA